MHWAHAHWGCDILWLQPYPVRLPRWSDLHRFKRSHVTRQSLGPTWREASWLQVAQPFSLPLEPLSLGRLVLRHGQRELREQVQSLLADEHTWLAIGRPSGLAVDLCTAVGGRRVLYDVMDDMPHFNQGLSQGWMQHTHEQLLRQAELVWGSSRKLVQAMQGRTQQPALLVRNGTTLPDASTLPPRHHDASRPLVLGYVGTIASWFDWHSLLELARALPAARVEVYGPLECTPPEPLPNSVTLHGPIPHDQVFALMSRWDAGLIPFVRNTLTASVDPVKYYEYRACGLPVLSTMFGEMPEHAQHDAGLWNMEDRQLLQQLPARLAQWQQERAQQLAQGASPIPDYIQAASWRARFASGSHAMEMI